MIVCVTGRLEEYVVTIVYVLGGLYTGVENVVPLRGSVEIDGVT